MCQKKRVHGALLLMGIGVVFLLNNFGLLPYGILGMIWKLWPLFLIIPGILILVRRK